MKRYFAVFITVYTIFLLYMMFFGSGREASDVSYIQMEPFMTIQKFFTDTKINNEDFLVNIIGNIFVFSPFGWLGLCLKKFNKFIPTSFYFLLIITSVETLQYVTGRGIADIDDIFLNTFGMLIGFFLFKYATWKNIANIRFHFQLFEEKSLQTTS
ncbi:VanZ family protein [Chryseobacterium luquanense]|uniref:VanZ family protein n=1 Tax=Chryseobacterium luquanense TaxID=2983766 RepID=A0ABT3Y3I3_9FLAO|nr:VanZ family protein [Chryseobacterium luquanense]MCX8532691.1 VanZ family protein [Chryseobacterium luquanense]